MYDELLNLSTLELYILLSRFHGRKPRRGILYWDVIPENLSTLDKYLPHLENPSIRLKILEKLIIKGIPPDVIADAIDWRGFEDLAGYIFKSFGYTVERDVRVRRYQFDIISYREDILFSVDCKHWDRIIYPSTASRIVDPLIKRTRILNSLDKYRAYKKYGLVVTLVEGGVREYKGIYFIPIYYLRNFLEEVYSLIFQGLLKDIGST